jgi:hypothetical protein
MLVCHKKVNPIIFDLVIEQKINRVKRIILPDTEGGTVAVDNELISFIN